ncbi:MAG: polysaccharide deacetylase family protein, partial [Patescibacteria group bacterium]
NLFFSILGPEYKILPLSRLGGEDEEDTPLLISYSKAAIGTRVPRQIHIGSSDFFGENYLKPESLPVLPLKKAQDLPIIFSGGELSSAGAPLSGGGVVVSNNLIETNIDIIAGSFFMLARYEEFLPGLRDSFGRFPMSSSLAFRAGFSSRPIVNEYLELFWQWIGSFNLDIKRKNLWPENKHFAAALTHDIDAVRKHGFGKTLKRAAGLALKRGDFKGAIAELKEFSRLIFKAKENDPFWSFERIAGLEKKQGVVSSFFFLALRKGKEYSVNDTDVSSLIGGLERGGFEVGLHGSFSSADNYEIMRSEKENLDATVDNRPYGSRQHALRWSAGVWQTQSLLGLLYDSSVGFVEDAGFRAGFCLPYKPFDLIGRTAINIWELPLIIMDTAVLRADNRGLAPQECLELIFNYIQTVKKHHGVLTILWHNYAFPPLDIPSHYHRWREMYEKTLQELNKEGALTGSGRDIINWWIAANKTYETDI